MQQGQRQLHPDVLGLQPSAGLLVHMALALRLGAGCLAAPALPASLPCRQERGDPPRAHCVHG